MPLRPLFPLALCGAAGCFLIHETSWRTDATAALPVPVDSSCIRAELTRALGGTEVRQRTHLADGRPSGIEFTTGTRYLFIQRPQADGTAELRATTGYGGPPPPADSMAGIDRLLTRLVANVATGCGAGGAEVTVQHRVN